jgi:hypothetical protein
LCPIVGAIKHIENIGLMCLGNPLPIVLNRNGNKRRFSLGLVQMLCVGVWLGSLAPFKIELNNKGQLKVVFKLGTSLALAYTHPEDLHQLEHPTTLAPVE